jgi:hypothetical protein
MRDRDLSRTQTTAGIYLQTAWILYIGLNLPDVIADFRVYDHWLWEGRVDWQYSRVEIPLIM